MAKKTNNEDLFFSMMDGIDEQVHITKSKVHGVDKIIIREDDTSPPASSSQLSNLSIPSSSRYEYVENSSGQRVKLRRSKVSKPESEIEIPKPVASPYFFLQVSEDNLQAHIIVEKRSQEPFKKEEILSYLSENGITYGILDDAIQNIVDGKSYYEDILIAQGTAAIDGQDGYYEYHFNTKPSTKPIILEDGSVDYNTLGKFDMAVKDQLLATYHKLKPHRDGMDVYGRILKAIEGKELPKLSGSGIELEADCNEYYANIEGKINFENGELSVIPLFVVDNLDSATGDLVFQGDIVVHGNVFSNVTVKATGNITVNGHVEVATLIAGKDILLKNGMQGSGAGRIFAKGNVMAKFLEQTVVQAYGNVSANAILNCNIFADKSVIVSGTRGSIVGGSVAAVEQIQASTIGNRIGIETKLVIGLEENFKTSMEKLDAEIDLIEDECRSTKRNLDRLAFQMKNNPNPALVADQKALTNQYETLISQLSRLQSKKERMSDIRERSSKGKIIVSGLVYPCSQIIMNGLSEVLSSERRDVTFSRSLREIRIISNKL